MNINRKTFNQYIADGDFRTLFIREMLWYNPQGQTEFDIIIEENTYRFECIAQRNGFQVLTCDTEEIPTTVMAKKIDTRLRRQANDYICIFRKPHTQHHLWVVPVNKVEKRDLVPVEYESTEAASFLYEKMDLLSFDFDEQTTIVDVKERVQKAFLVNSEKVTKDFYTGFKREHNNFAKFITGIDDHITVSENRNKQWYTSVMLNRLMFCYFIQKKGFLDGDADYLRHKLEWTQQERGADRFFSSFYKGFLVNLFHGGLNAPNHNDDFENIYGRIPYLNGGMFDVHQIEHDYAGLDIADDAFVSLFNFFDKWHWHLDDRLTASGRDINPDVLGYIFEQYINDRAQMGAYYTKEDITEYIGRNTIVPYLMEATRKHDEKPFRPAGEVWTFLSQSGDRYIFDAVKKGAGLTIPDEIAIGIDTTQPNLLDRRNNWNDRTPEDFALPTEIWRETIERLQRYDSIKAKIVNGEITSINDFITYNLDIRRFVADLLNQTTDHKLIKHFYAELQRVTILDPTCGSGAFLFAALNILEPLYEVCILRMQEFNEQQPNLFKDELQEIAHKYRSNIQYFIFKSIILRNLYGVDIMVEATEIAKLRLFLKMVAVVDVNKRVPNYGLDPLPDIDFNIRCGNTPVGYATKSELDDDLAYGDMFAAAEFRDKAEDEMDKVAHVYEAFKHIQLSQAEDIMVFKQAKSDLKKRLTALNDFLNKKMYGTIESDKSYDEWLANHQPFHWLAEFYEIINDRGGFDVVIGNPPYVVYKEQNYPYRISRQYETISCSNLYAFVLERSTSIISKHGCSGYIIPISSVSNDKFVPLERILLRESLSWFSSFSNRPGKLFENVEQRLTIVISISGIKTNRYFASRYQHWYVEERENLFQKLFFYPNRLWDNNLSLFKIGSQLENDICSKLYITAEGALRTKLSSFLTGNKYCFFHNAPTYFIRAMSFKPNNGEGMKESSHYKMLACVYEQALTCVLNSSLYYWFFKNISNCRDFATREILPFPIGNMNDLNFENISERLCESYTYNRTVKNRVYPSGLVYYEEYYPAKSKPIIDEIDKVLAKHYGFTEEELDFIINYDIKYRMGEELGEE